MCRRSILGKMAEATGAGAAGVENKNKRFRKDKRTCDAPERAVQ